MKKYLGYLAGAQTLGCVLVVMGHSYPFNTYIPDPFYGLRDFIYCFHMPLFVFISGFLLVRTRSIQKYGVGKYLGKRALRLLLPYFVWSLIGILPKFSLGAYLNDNTEASVEYFVKAVFIPRQNIWGHFWFLPMIFLLAALSWPLLKLLEKAKTGFYVLLAASFVLLYLRFPLTDWFAVNDVKRHLFYYLLGMAAANSAGRLFAFFRSGLPLKKKTAALAGAIPALALGVIFFLIGGRGFEPGVSIFMITGVILLCLAVPIHEAPVLSGISQRVYPVFILSWPCQLIFEVAGNQLLRLPYFAVMPMMLAAGLLIPLVIIRIVDLGKKRFKWDFLSYLIGE